jgi:hypothetical protein
MWGACLNTLVLKHAEKLLYNIDKLDMYGENSNVTATKVVQNIDNKIDYLTHRVENRTYMVKVQPPNLILNRKIYRF